MVGSQNADVRRKCVTMPGGVESDTPADAASSVEIGKPRVLTLAGGRIDRIAWVCERCTAQNGLMEWAMDVLEVSDREVLGRGCRDRDF